MARVSYGSAAPEAVWVNAEAWGSYRLRSETGCATVLDKWTNVDDNLPWSFNYFVAGDLRVIYQSAEFRTALRCWILTSILVIPAKNPWNASAYLSLSTLARSSMAPLNASY